MDFSWVSLLFLSFIFTSAVHVYQPPDSLWILFLIAGFLFFSTNLRLPEKEKRVRTIKNTASVWAVVIALQCMFFPIYYNLISRYHEERILAALCAPVMNLFGVKTVADNGVLFIESAYRTIVFPGAWEKAGLVHVLLLLVGGFTMLVMKKARAKHFCIFTGFTILYSILRYVFLLLIYTAISAHSIFWERTFSFATFIPYALSLRFIFRNLEPPAISVFEYSRKSKKAVVIAGLLGFLLVFTETAYFGFHAAGREKQGRVVVDEYHSDWEWTTEEYDQSWYGERSGYNYYCFYDHISRFYETRRSHTEITEETLRDADIFIIKTPTMPFSDDEVSIIVSFVEKGGGLYLIGDHTNVFGTGYNLNQISELFGIRFNYDCTYELVEGSLSEYDTPLLAHPSIHNLPHFLFATTNTLDMPWYAQEIMVSYGLKNFQADYSQKNFFPEDSNAAEIQFGLFPQSCAVQYGKGSVLAFTDSTVYSNFWMFMPGKPELLLGSLQWLNRENAFPGQGPRLVLAPVFITLLLANFLFWYINRDKFLVVVWLLSGLCALLCGVFVFSMINKRILPPPEPKEPYVSICFERGYSQFKLSDNLEGFLADASEQLNTFYVWTQRLGCVPSVEKDLESALKKGYAAVLVKPGAPIKNPEKVLALVEEGANLVILDNLASGGHSNGLLRLAGMELSALDLAGTDVDALSSVGGGIRLTENASAVIGGEDEGVLSASAGQTILAVKHIGAGMIVVLSDPDLMFNSELGDVSANLTERTEKITQLEYDMFNIIFEN